MGRLETKVAVITGSGAGLGAEAAKLFAQEGCAVVVNDVNADAGQQVVGEIQKAGRQGGSSFPGTCVRLRR